MSVTALAPWYGSARMVAQHVGDALHGCHWVGIPFAGGCCELLTIQARTVLVNDLHRHMMNMAWVLSHRESLDWLKSELARMPFHPDVLLTSQNFCRDIEQEPVAELSNKDKQLWALHYFNCCWMTRSGSAGTPQEFTAALSTRWSASGGDSNVRYRSAIESLETFHTIIIDRCTFSTMDVFDFLNRCLDRQSHGLYLDPPFFDVGLKYSHNPGAKSQHAFYEQLAERLRMFRECRVVVRSYDTPFVRHIFQEGWTFSNFTGRKQTNAAAPELLIVRNGKDVQ